jgi:hypothetical protein
VKDHGATKSHKLNLEVVQQAQLRHRGEKGCKATRIPWLKKETLDIENKRYNGSIFCRTNPKIARLVFQF